LSTRPAKPAKDGKRRKRILEKDASITMRVPVTLKAYAKRWGSSQPTKLKEATTARLALEVFQGITEALGNDWLTLQSLAHVKGQSVGEYVGAKVRDALRVEFKNHK
jgi:hypothetical protein